MSALFTEDPTLDKDWIRGCFRAADVAQGIPEEDLKNLTIAFEHGQWWVIVNHTGESFSVVDVERDALRGREHTIDFEPLQ